MAPLHQVDTRIELNIPLKGERKYLQSANILWDVLQYFSHRRGFNLEFRRMIYKPVYLAPDDPTRPNRAAKIALEQETGWLELGIFVDEDREITERIPNNETEILAESRFDGDTARASINRPANFIDTTVALNKILVGRYSKGKKAIFSAISLDVVPGKGEIGVDLTKRLGSRIFMSDVVWNGDRIGKLTFMAV